MGSRAMVIALPHAIREMGINYREQLHATAADVDLESLDMADALLHLVPCNRRRQQDNLREHHRVVEARERADRAAAYEPNPLLRAQRFQSGRVQQPRADVDHNTTHR